MQQAINKNSGSGKQQADGLIAMEEPALGFAAGGAFLLNSVVLQFVRHARQSVRHGQYSEGWIAQIG